jgi:K+-sensing histidine kinase KdpD
MSEGRRQKASSRIRGDLTKLSAQVYKTSYMSQLGHSGVLEADDPLPKGAAFLQRVKHELRTPLNHLIGYSELLLQEYLEEGAVEEVEGIERVHELSRNLIGVIDLIFSSNPTSDPAKILDQLRQPVRDAVTQMRRLDVCTEGRHLREPSVRAKDLKMVGDAIVKLLAVTENGWVDMVRKGEDGTSSGECPVSDGCH